MRVSRQSPLSLRPGGGHCIATAEWCGGIRCAPLVRVDPAGSTSVQAARRSYRCWRPPTSGIATTVPSPAGVTRNRRIFVERQMRAGPFVVRTIERADVGGHGRPPDVAPALPGPPQPEAPSVPGDDGLRFHDDERRSPLGPDAQEDNPEPPVRSRARQPPRPRALQHLQLVL